MSRCKIEAKRTLCLWIVACAVERQRNGGTANIIDKRATGEESEAERRDDGIGALHHAAVLQEGGEAGGWVVPVVVRAPPGRAGFPRDGAGEEREG